MLKLVPLSPEWWVARLHSALQNRQLMVERCDAYYRGDHPLPWLAPQAHEEFRRVLQMTRSNYMGLVVDATAERLKVEGFRIGESNTGDRETWRIWQANDLDADSDKGVLESLISGQSYLLVAPNVVDRSLPHMWVEHASQAIVEYQPGTNRRVPAAGLKVWDDEWSGDVHATLYLPAEVYKFRAKRNITGPGFSVGKADWRERRVAGEEWPAPNPLGVVPLVELPNNPRLLTGGVSEIADVMCIQDRINKTIADRLVTQDYGAFPQKWVSGWPLQDEGGNPTPEIAVGRDRMVTTDVTEAKFGQWDAAALDPYSMAKREDVKDVASRTRTPAQYLLGELNNVNAATLKATESGLISKVRQRMRPLGEGLEQGTRIARRAAGLPDGGDASMEVMWRNPEYRTEGELTDAVVKRYQAGIASLRQSREDVGYSTTQIARLEAEDADAALRELSPFVKPRPAFDEPLSGESAA